MMDSDRAELGLVCEAAGWMGLVGGGGGRERGGGGVAQWPTLRGGSTGRACHPSGMTCRSGGSRSVTMLRVAERVSHSTGAAAVVSPAPETISSGCPPQPVGHWTG